MVMVLLPELEKKCQSPDITVRLTMVNSTSLAQGSLKTLLNMAPTEDPSS